jgi:hypothetical protein
MSLSVATGQYDTAAHSSTSSTAGLLNVTFIGNSAAVVGGGIYEVAVWWWSKHDYGQ